MKKLPQKYYDEMYFSWRNKKRSWWSRNSGYVIFLLAPLTYFVITLGWSYWIIHKELR